MGWRRIAEEELPRSSHRPGSCSRPTPTASARTCAANPGEVAVEYSILGLQLPTAELEWSPVDSLSWLKAMAWDLRSNYDDELTRARLSGRLTPAQINQIYPGYDYRSRPPILSSQEWEPTEPERATRSAVPSALTTGAPAATAAEGRLASPGARQAYAAVQRRCPPSPSSSGAATAWARTPGRSPGRGRPPAAAAGERPHLAVGQPGIWIQNSLLPHRLAGLPPRRQRLLVRRRAGVVIGHNADIAWGFTNLGPDVSDFYLERVVGDTYLRDGDWETITTREEVIRGGRRRPAHHRPQHGATRSCPTSSRGSATPAPEPRPQEGDETEAYAVSLAWTGLLPGRTADADPRPQPRDGLRGAAARPGRSRCPPRTCSTPTGTATSATRLPVRSRCAARRCRAHRRPGPHPAGTRPMTGGVRRVLGDAMGARPDDGVIVTANQPVAESSRPSSPPTGTGVALDPHRRAARRARQGLAG